MIKDIKIDRAVMINIIKYGITSIFGILIVYLNMTGRTIMQIDMKRGLFSV